MTALIFACALGAITSSPAAFAGTVSPISASWCSAHGSSLVAWSGTTPDLPLCGPGPAYGGTWAYVDVPGPYGAAGYYNATPGFQCVELAERFLAVVDGLAPVHAEGSTVAEEYHLAYPETALVVNGSAGAVGHPPRAGGVISFSEVPGFDDPSDGHVAIVVSSSVDARTGDGTVEIAQQNVSINDFRRTLDLVDWRLVDPSQPSDAQFQYPYAEWLNVATAGAASASGSTPIAPMPLLIRDSLRGSLAVAIRLASHLDRARRKVRPELVHPATGPLVTARLLEGRA